MASWYTEWLDLSRSGSIDKTGKGYAKNCRKWPEKTGSGHGRTNTTHSLDSQASRPHSLTSYYLLHSLTPHSQASRNSSNSRNSHTHTKHIMYVEVVTGRSPSEDRHPAVSQNPPAMTRRDEAASRSLIKGLSPPPLKGLGLRRRS